MAFTSSCNIPGSFAALSSVKGVEFILLFEIVKVSLSFQGLLNKTMEVTTLMGTTWNLKESNIQEDNPL